MGDTKKWKISMGLVKHPYLKSRCKHELNARVCANECSAQSRNATMDIVGWLFKLDACGRDCEECRGISERGNELCACKVCAGE